MLAPLLLILLEVINLFRNIKPGAYLIGWDNLFPEFNLPLNFQRSLFSLWQEYRGLGLLDGMAHGANLLHTLYISILSLFLPQNLLRFVFIHLTHLVGGVGFYYLLFHLTKHKKASLLGAAFYMFNLGIVQMYFAPLEVFAIHFAALPWLTLVILQTFKKTNRRNLITLFIVSLLTSPQGFVPTVFIAFLILFFFLLLFHILHTRKFKQAIIIGLCVFLGNAFWMLPYLVSALKTPEIIQNTRINQYGSEEIYYRNKAHGTLLDTLELKGFMLTTVEYDQEKSTDIFFMDEWRKVSSQWWYHIIFATFLVIALYGAFKIIKHKNRTLYPFIATYAVLFIFLANNTLILDQINTLLRAIFPLLGEAFRFPFTKFITVFVFCLSIILTVGLAALAQRAKRYATLTLIVLSLGLIAINFPIATGNFTSPLLRLNVPQEYFDLISYMNTQNPNQRVAMLPTHTFWNWHYRTWGHRGSGFLWYGLQQPTLERAFDPWSLENEQQYNELAYAINTQDQTLLNTVLEKYDISYLLIDEYIVNTISTQPVNFNRLAKFLDENPYLQKDKTFGRLLLYKTESHPEFVYQIPAPQQIMTSASTRKDQAFIDNGTYVAGTTLPNLIYPLSSLFTEKLQKDVSFQTKHTDSEIKITQQIASPLSAQARISIPSIYASDYLIPVKVTYSDKIVTLTPLYPEIAINGQSLLLPAQPFSLKAPVDVTEIEFNDMDQKVSLDKPVVTYLLRDYLNTITLSSKTSKLTTTIDTKSLSKSPIILPLGQDKIGSISVTVPKSTGVFSIPNVIASRNFLIQKSDPGLHPFTSKKSVSESLSLGDGLELFAKSASVQVNFFKPNLPHQQAYILLADADYKKGLPVGWYMDNTQEKRAEVEGLFAKKDGLNTFILPSSQDIFTGYGFHFTLKSVGTEDAATTLNSIGIYPFPQILLEGITIANGDTKDKAISRQETEYSEIHPGLFVAQVSANLPTLVLSQKYDSGWSAYYFDKKPGIMQTYLPFWGGRKLSSHERLDNWSNAWSVTNPNSGYVVISFMPMYIQYLGLFITFVATPLFILGIKLRTFRRQT